MLASFRLQRAFLWLDKNTKAAYLVHVQEYSADFNQYYLLASQMNYQSQKLKFTALNVKMFLYQKVRDLRIPQMQKAVKLLSMGHTLAALFHQFFSWIFLKMYLSMDHSNSFQWFMDSKFMDCQEVQVITKKISHLQFECGKLMFIILKILTD